VHGYTGSPASLAPLECLLAAELGPAAVRSVLLPGHGGGRVPPFDADAFVAEVRHAAEPFDGPLVLVGHSTGGTVLLAAAAALRRPPALAILAGTPPRIDAGYAARWPRHAGAGGPPLDEIAALVSLVNRLSRTRHPFPLLVLNGEADALVPAAEAERWRGRGSHVRVVRIADGDHDLFCGPAGAVAVDVAARAVRDALAASAAPDDAAWSARAGLAAAAARWPVTVHHVRAGPAGRALEGRAPDAEELAQTEPTILNVSVTTRCDLACRACARAIQPVEPADMAPETFARVLEQVPHAARVVMVGLGEPLLHPAIVELVRRGADADRRVSLVTNGMRLTPALGFALIEAGLSALTVSIDAASPDGVARARSGSRLETVLQNLSAFVEERRRAGREAQVGVAVFTALAADTAGELEGIVDAVAPLGVDALMVTDLNFPENQPRSLHRGLGPEGAARLDRTLRGALARGLPVLSVHGLEELALPERFREVLVLRGSELAARATRHAHCRSPWQTLPVGPDGAATLCDCQPGVPLGNVLREPLSAIWNGGVARAHRRRMRSDDPPPACLGCPRF
jgi:MoaA/NifB/PqqE/SkfB family radical SAM enzyme/surfactin synthase thioesterase subunit